MTWRNDPEIRHLREYSRLFDAPIVVTFAVHREGGTFGIISYGEDANLCQVARGIADQIADAIVDGTITPSMPSNATEPSSQTWKKVDDEQED